MFLLEKRRKKRKNAKKFSSPPVKSLKFRYNILHWYLCLIVHSDFME